MNIINTSAVALGAAMPYKSTMIDFLKDGTKSDNTMILSSIVGNSSLSGYYCLAGCESTGSVTYTIAAGYVMRSDGEALLAIGNTITLSVGQVIIGTKTSFYTTGYDPVTFSDGTTHNVHEQTAIVWSAGTSGSGDFDYNDLVFLHEQWQSPTYLTGWSDDNWNFNGGLKYKRDMIGNALVFKGSCQSSNNGGTGNPVFTLPAAYRPATSKTLPIIINEDSGSTIVVAFLLISASTGNVMISSATASTTIDIASFDGIRIPLD